MISWEDQLDYLEEDGVELQELLDEVLNDAFNEIFGDGRERGDETPRWPPVDEADETCPNTDFANDKEPT